MSHLLVIILAFFPLLICLGVGKFRQHTGFPRLDKKKHKKRSLIIDSEKEKVKMPEMECSLNHKEPFMQRRMPQLDLISTGERGRERERHSQSLETPAGKTSVFQRFNAGRTPWGCQGEGGAVGTSVA